MFCMLGGIFALRWLSYSVAGRGVVNTKKGTTVPKTGASAPSPKPPFKKPLDSVHTRCIVKTSGFTRVFVKIGELIKF